MNVRATQRPYRVPWFFSKNAARVQIIGFMGKTCSACA